MYRHLDVEDNDDSARSSEEEVAALESLTRRVENGLAYIRDRLLSMAAVYDQMRSAYEEMENADRYVMSTTLMEMRYILQTAQEDIDNLAENMDNYTEVGKGNLASNSFLIKLTEMHVETLSLTSTIFDSEIRSPFLQTYEMLCKDMLLVLTYLREQASDRCESCLASSNVLTELLLTADQDLDSCRAMSENIINEENQILNFIEFWNSWRNARKCLSEIHQRIEILHFEITHDLRNYDFNINIIKRTGIDQNESNSSVSENDETTTSHAATPKKLKLEMTPKHLKKPEAEARFSVKRWKFLEDSQKNQDSPIAVLKHSLGRRGATYHGSPDSYICGFSLSESPSYLLEAAPDEYLRPSQHFSEVSPVLVWTGTQNNDHAEDTNVVSSSTSDSEWSFVASPEAIVVTPLKKMVGTHSIAPDRRKKQKTLDSSIILDLQKRLFSEPEELNLSAIAVTSPAESNNAIEQLTGHSTDNESESSASQEQKPLQPSTSGVTPRSAVPYQPIFFWNPLEPRPHNRQVIIPKRTIPFFPSLSPYSKRTTLANRSRGLVTSAVSTPVPMPVSSTSSDPVALPSSCPVVSSTTPSPESPNRMPTARQPEIPAMQKFILPRSSIFHITRFPRTRDIYRNKQGIGRMTQIPTARPQQPLRRQMTQISEDSYNYNLHVRYSMASGVTASSTPFTKWLTSTSLYDGNQF